MKYCPKTLARDLERRGVTLVGAIVIMLMLAVIGVTLVSLLGVTSRASLDQVRSSQALGIAQGGLNWYAMYLAGLSDWTAAAAQTDVALGVGAFDVAINSQTAATIYITVTGKVAGTGGAVIKRTMSQRFSNFTGAAKYALFWGYRTGTSVSLTGTSVSGNYWSAGSSVINSPSAVTNGVVYYPTSDTVSGSGTYLAQSVTTPPAMPAIDYTYYTNIMTGWDTTLAAISGSTSTIWNTDHVLAGGITIIQRDFITRGTMTISGYGTIACGRDMLLHTNNSGTLTISPSGGRITFLCTRTMTVGSIGATINGNTGGTDFYASNIGGAVSMVSVTQPTTTLRDCNIWSERRIMIQGGAKIYGANLFLTYPNNTTNNYLRITGAGTTVGSLASPCTVVSGGRNSGAGRGSLSLDTGASVTGLVYQYDAGNLGSAYINNATITGTTIVNKVNNNAITSSTLTYDPAAIPDPPPTGFSGSPNTKVNSWDGI